MNSTMQEHKVYSFLGVFVLFLISLPSFWIFGFGISNPWIWIIELVFLILICILGIKVNKKIGSILSVIIILIFCWSASRKQIFCWNYGVPDGEVNQMIDVSYLPESDRSRYTFGMSNYQPGGKLVIGKGFKAMVDCENDVSFGQMLYEIFTKNW